MATDRRPRSGLRATAAAVWLLLPGAALAQGTPLSAIDWLSDTVAARPAPAAPAEPPARPPGELAPITTTALAARNLDAAGVLPGVVTGLAPGLWTASDSATLTALIRDERPDPLPALRDLMQTLLLAEQAPPLDADGQGAFLLARIDKLLDMGALDAAAALVDVANPPTPDLFRRGFDIALLLGTEDAACAEQRKAPAIAPTFPARIFCLARGGDWQAAELTLHTARALGQIGSEDEALLERFLAPELFEGEPPLPPPARLSPLVLRMLEAIGEPVSSTGLPLAFAHGDLTPATGWKARLEAAERLARVGAITPGQLFAVYAERMPAASGGVWDRVSAVQRFEAALSGADRAAVAATLPRVWDVLAERELEVALAEVHGAALSGLDLPDAAGALAFRIALLGPDYEAAALARTPADGDEAFLSGIARGLVTVPPPPDGMARAIAPVFGDRMPPLPEPLQALLDQGRTGEAALVAIDRITTGVLGDLRGVTEGLAILRRVGMEGAARKAALQLMLLERRG